MSESRTSILLGDLAAGATVGLVAVPQAIAFAQIAGVPPEVALATMIVPGLVAGFLRDSPHLASGATNTAALLVGATLASSRLPAEVGLAPVLGTLCLLVGLVKGGVGALRLGRLSRYVSPAVVEGFTLGAAVLLVLGQLPGALGVEGAGGTAPRQLAALLVHARDSHAPPLLVAAATLAVIGLLYRVAPRVPGPLVALALVAAAVALLGWSADPRLAMLGEVPRRLPSPALPALSLRAFEELAVPSLALALVGMTEVVSIGKSLAMRVGRTFHGDRELVAQGAANLASAFFACLPSSVSWTRSAASLDAGARTPFSVIVASVTVAVFVLAAAPLARFLPLAAVAGVVLWIAVRMVNANAIRRMRRTDPADFAILVTTAAATLVLPLPVAVFCGVALSLGLVVSRASLLRVSELRRSSLGHLVEQPLDADTGKTRLTLLQLEGDLFFGVADELEGRLDAVAANGTRGIVLRVRRTHALDGSAADALVRFAMRFRAGGGAIALCGLRPELEPRVERSGLAAALGEDAVFETGGRPFAALERAVARVQQALGDAPGLQGVRTAEEGDSDPGWSI